MPWDQKMKGDIKAVKCEEADMGYQREHIWMGRGRYRRGEEVGEVGRGLFGR
jgi:hypothetical protein